MSPAQLSACRTVDDWLGRQWARFASSADAADAPDALRFWLTGGTSPMPVRTDFESLPGSAGDNPVFRFTLDTTGTDSAAFPPALPPTFPRQIYAKVYPDDDVDQLHRRLVRLSNALVVADASLRVPALLSLDPQRRCLLQAAAQGRMLAELRPGAALDAALQRVGQALAQLHAVPLDSWCEPRHEAGGESGIPLTAARLDSQIATLMRPHPELLALARPALRSRIGALLHQMRRLAERPSAAWQPVLLHRDLHPRQLFVPADPGDPVELIDWDLAGPGDPALDLANLLMHLELRWPEAAPTAGAALLAGYGMAHASCHARHTSHTGHTGMVALAARLPLYRAFFHLRRACKAQRLSNSADLVEQRLALAERAIAGAALMPRSTP